MEKKQTIYLSKGNITQALDVLEREGYEVPEIELRRLHLRNR